MQLKKYNPRRGDSGITLIEVMVSLLFLSIGLIPLFGVIISSINLSTRIKNNLIASGLAQEGIEVVRSLRDKAWMENATYDRDLTAGDHLLSWNSTTLMPYDPMEYIKIDPSTGIYSQTTGTPTIFKRKVNITKIVSPCNCEVMVTSEVSWVEKNKNRSISVENHLFNWRQ